VDQHQPVIHHTNSTIQPKDQVLSSVPITNGVSGKPSVSAQNSTQQSSVSQNLNSTTTLSNPLRKAVVSAVYSDINDQARRAANLVITGVIPEDGVGDGEFIEALLQNEFDYKPVIKKCFRLGKPLSGKIQPILITLQSKDQADFIASHAKQLRKSKNAYVQDKIFINRDLTKAQAAFEYEARCSRRLRAASSHPTTASSWASVVSGQPSSAHLQTSTESEQSSTMDVARNSQLNVTVPEFHPPTSMYPAGSGPGSGVISNE
jgi:hypothetical protein